MPSIVHCTLLVVEKLSTWDDEGKWGDEASSSFLGF